MDRTAGVAKAVGRVLDGLERQLGRPFTDVEVDTLVAKSISSRTRLSRAGDVDLWGSGGRTGTEPLDTTSSGQHAPVRQGGGGKRDDGHPDYEYSRPLEGEDKLRRLIGKGSLGMDDEQATGQDDPTVFEDGPAPAREGQGMRSEDTDSPTAAPNRAALAKEEIDRPVTLEVSDQFEDAPAVEAEVESHGAPQPQLETDTRGVERNPLNLRVGSQDALALSHLHRTMFRRAIRDRRYDIKVVEKQDDGSEKILEGQE